MCALCHQQVLFRFISRRLPVCLSHSTTIMCLCIFYIRNTRRNTLNWFLFLVFVKHFVPLRWTTSTSTDWWWWKTHLRTTTMHGKGQSLSVRSHFFSGFLVVDVVARRRHYHHQHHRSLFHFLLYAPFIAAVSRLIHRIGPAATVRQLSYLLCCTT